MMKLRPLVKIHGGKYYLASWIISHFPPEYCKYSYCESFIGGGSVFLQKKSSVIVEYINDLDSNLIALWKFIRAGNYSSLNKLTYGQETFDKALAGDYPLPIREYIVRRMSRGGMGKTFSWSDRLRGGIPGDVNAWNTALEQLPLIKERLKNTSISNEDALEFIDAHNTYFSLHYVDPPYLHKTRTASNVYSNEMSEKDHEELLHLLDGHRGKIILSGYDSKLYRDKLSNWNFKTKNIVNHSSQSKKKQQRTECLWMNY